MYPLYMSQYHSVLNLLHFHRLSENIKTEIYKTVIFPVVLCEIWYLVLWEEHGLRVFGKRVLRRLYGPMRNNRRLEKIA
jgi:hypothetical protein